MQTQKRSNSKFFLLLAIFVLPVLASWLLFYNHGYFKLKTMNHGNLITPPVQIMEEIKNTEKGKHWQIVYAPQNCATTQCEKMMFTLHQLQKALGKDFKRISLTLITDKNYQLKPTPAYHHLIFNSMQYAKWQTELAQHTPALQNALLDKIYLVDPIGNLFMYYPDSTNPMDIMKDLKRLLEVSQIG